MFLKRLNRSLIIALPFLLVLFSGCPSAGSGGSGGIDYNPVINTSELSGSTYLDIPNSQIINITSGMEYSLDDKSTWSTSSQNPQEISLTTGADVWVRNTGDSSTEQYIGTVESLNGPDLYPGNVLHIGTFTSPYWYDLPSASATPGETLNILSVINNIGNSESASGHTIKFYLSEDTEITISDTLLTSYTYGSSCIAGSTLTCIPDFAVPSVTDGSYYVGCIVDQENSLSEINERNNTTAPTAVVPLIIKDTSAAASGAVKIYNSWGEGGWENQADGYYWMPYDVLKANNMLVSYYYNDFTREYNPTAVLEFALSHPYRDQCRITVGLGDPDSPFMQKLFQSEWSSTYLLSGGEPFPANSIVLDISEFAGYLNSYDLFFKVENLGSSSGSLSVLNLELYSDYSNSPFKILDSVSASLPATLASNAITTIYLSSAGNISISEQLQILPMTRATAASGVSFEERLPSSTEVAAAVDHYGVYEAGKNYNKIIYNTYGTGFAPPTIEQWRTTPILDNIEASVTAGTLPLSVDNSSSIYFPPTGNQGAEGSCAAFSTAYYIQTYTEAREHSWNLSGVSWTGGLSGSPDSHLDNIFSPDFIYHQINQGGDNGSSTIDAAELIIRIGGATWDTMPYDTADSVSWPSAPAWREAAQYRGREPGQSYWANSVAGYFTIDDDSDIQLLKSLLSAGYCVSTAIDSTTVYNAFDGNDVVSSSAAWSSVDHAQTIVGYKEGTEWNASTPDS